MKKNDPKKSNDTPRGGQEIRETPTQLQGSHDTHMQAHVKGVARASDGGGSWGGMGGGEDGVGRGGGEDGGGGGFQIVNNEGANSGGGGGGGGGKAYDRLGRR